MEIGEGSEKCTAPSPTPTPPHGRTTPPIIFTAYSVNNVEIVIMSFIQPDGAPGIFQGNKVTQRARDAIITSSLRQHDVADVVLT